MLCKSQAYAQELNTKKTSNVNTKYGMVVKQKAGIMFPNKFVIRVMS